MRIGILGAGHIGKSLARDLPVAGHEVKVANSRGPETIAEDVLEGGAQGVAAADAVKDVDVLIVSVPLGALASVVPLVAQAPSDAVVIDTSNYYPSRDGEVEALEAGQVESLWVTEQLGRSVVKAWNTIGSDSLAKLGLPAGSPDRIALPVAADDAGQRIVGMELVEQSGFDAFDAGTLAESWRQQPGTPCYCTDLTLAELPGALASADRTRSPARRDLAVSVIMERMGDGTTNPDADFSVRLHRVLFM
jgi:8-hydroxy-5-deazaflavin:NADPH oxidoreductase